MERSLEGTPPSARSRAGRDVASGIADEYHWKLAHPCVGEDTEHDAKTSHYASALLQNMSDREKSVFVDSVFALKSLAALLADAEADLASLARRHVRNVALSHFDDDHPGAAAARAVESFEAPTTSDLRALYVASLEPAAPSDEEEEDDEGDDADAHATSSPRPGLVERAMTSMHVAGRGASARKTRRSSKGGASGSPSTFSDASSCFWWAKAVLEVGASARRCGDVSRLWYRRQGRKRGASMSLQLVSLAMKCVKERVHSSRTRREMISRPKL